VPAATFAGPDLTTFARLHELGLEVTGQRLDPDRAVLACRVVEPERKAAKNRLHLDISVSGGRAVPIETRRQRVDAEAVRLAGLGAEFAGAVNTEGLDHYAVAMKDPEGNEFDIN
jgi:Glyoxalase-like domain